MFAPRTTIDYGNPVNRLSPLNRGLVAWWIGLPAQPQVGRLRDIASKTEGVLQNGLSWNGITGDNLPAQRLLFDGSDDYVRFSSAYGITAYPFTTSVYVKFTSVGGTQCIFSFNYSGTDDVYWGLECRGGVASMTARNTSFVNIAGTTSLTTTDWWHICGVYTSATSRELFVNGRSEGTSSTSVSLAATTNQVLIGRLRDVSPTDYTSAYIGEARMWNRALSGDEVWAVYQSIRTGYQNELNRISRPVGVKKASATFKAAWARRSNQVIGVTGAA